MLGRKNQRNKIVFFVSPEKKKMSVTGVLFRDVEFNVELFELIYAQAHETMISRGQRCLQSPRISIIKKKI